MKLNYSIIQQVGTAHTINLQVVFDNEEAASAIPSAVAALLDELTSADHFETEFQVQALAERLASAPVEWGVGRVVEVEPPTNVFYSDTQWPSDNIPDIEPLGYQVTAEVPPTPQGEFYNALREAIVWGEGDLDSEDFETPSAASLLSSQYDGDPE